LKRPELLDQAVIKLVRPLSLTEGDDLLSVDDEFGPIAPLALEALGERKHPGVSRIPKTLRRPNLLSGSRKSEGRQWWPRVSCLRRHISFPVIFSMFVGRSTRPRLASKTTLTTFAAGPCVGTSGSKIIPLTFMWKFSRYNA
jgi:hypothetical protein